MPRKRSSRIYTRSRGGEDRYWGDFRDYSDVGGRQEALVAKGASMATTDPDIAEALATRRVRELERIRRGKVILDITREDTIQRFAATHLKKKAKGIRKGLVTERWLSTVENHLSVAIEFFSPDADIASITVADVQEYCDHLDDLPSGRRDGATLSPGTQRKYLNSLSNLYRRAESEGIVPPGYNPVAALMDKPSAGRHEAAWLEVPQATLLLEAARTYRPPAGSLAHPAIYELLAMFLLTGGREMEVCGLDLEDVSFDRKIIKFRPNKWRRLKTETSHRAVPLWPQLEEILRPYVFGSHSPRSGLLFPSPRTGRMITDVRKVLDRIAGRIGYDSGEVRTKIFRHTYCAARLQTLDREVPVSPWTVAREMGHGGRDLVDRVYGHLGTVGHRSEFVEYRPEHYMEDLGETIANLRAQERFCE